MRVLCVTWQHAFSVNFMPCLSPLDTGTSTSKCYSQLELLGDVEKRHWVARLWTVCMRKIDEEKMSTQELENVLKLKINSTFTNFILRNFRTNASRKSYQKQNLYLSNTDNRSQPPSEVSVWNRLMGLSTLLCSTSRAGTLWYLEGNFTSCLWGIMNKLMISQ